MSENSQKRAKYISIVVLLGTIVFAKYYDFLMVILGKLNTIRTASSESSTDLSGFALVSNARIAYHKMLDGYIFGTGYNSHRLYYDYYISSLYNSVYMKLNYADAGSMYTRVFSEFGIAGLLCMMGVLINYIRKASKEKDKLHLLFVTVLILSFTRDGSYLRTINLVLICILFLEGFNTRKDKTMKGK